MAGGEAIELKEVSFADLAPVAPRLTRSFKVLNKFFNTLAYNPPGAAEPFLFWAGWLAHAGATAFLSLGGDREAADIIQPDICLMGGLLEMKKVAAIVDRAVKVATAVKRSKNFSSLGSRRTSHPGNGRRGR